MKASVRLLNALKAYRDQISFEGEGVALAAVGVATLLATLSELFFAPTEVIFYYPLAAALSGLSGRRPATVLAAILGTLCADFFFLDPRWSLAVHDAASVRLLWIVLVTSLFLGRLVASERIKSLSVLLRQQPMVITHTFTQCLGIARGVEKVAEILHRELEEVFHCHPAVFLPNEEGRLEPLSARSVEPQEQVTAQWVYDNGSQAGMGAASLPDLESLFIPLHGVDMLTGVLRIKPRADRLPLSPEEKTILQSFADQIALAFEASRQDDMKKKAQIEAESERLRQNLVSPLPQEIKSRLADVVLTAKAMLEKRPRFIKPTQEPPHNP